MKGLILAGGAGTRLRPLTHTGAKQLVPVANRPILFYVLDQMSEADIKEVCVVISPETGKEIRTALDAENERAHLGLQLQYVLQEEPRGLAHAVQVAHDCLGRWDDFCMFLGDNLSAMSLRSAARAFRHHVEWEASLMLKAVPNPSSFGVAEVDADGKLIGLEEKPAQPKSNLALMGIYFFRSSIHQAIAQIKPSARGELEITDAIRVLLETGQHIHVETVKEWWLDTGKKDDLLLANDTVLDDWLTTQNEGQVDAETRLSGRVRIAPGAILERCLVRGPVIIGAGAHLVDARIGPFTSIGPGCRLVRTCVSRSVLLEGAHIEDVARVEDAVIGRRAMIHPGDSRPGALSVLIGDDCRIELAKGGW